MATKIIKFHDNNTTYVPVTLASAVQYSYSGGVMSVQDAIGTIASSVVTSTSSISDNITNLQTAYTNHTNTKVDFSYDSGNVTLSGAHGASTKTIKAEGLTYIKSSGNDIIIGTSATSNTGTVTKVSTAGAITGGDITTTGTIEHVKQGPSSSDNTLVQQNEASATLSEGKTFKIAQLTINEYGHVTAATDVTYTMPSEFTAKAHDHTMTLSGTKVTAAQTDNLVEVIKTLPGTLTTASANSYTTYVVPTKEYVDTKVADMSKALKYQGTISAGSTSFPSGAQKGDVYVFAGECTIGTETYEKGDMAVYDGSNWTVVNANWTASDGTAQLNWGQTTTLAEIGGVTIDATMPEKPTLSSVKSNTAGNFVKQVTVDDHAITYVLDYAYNKISQTGDASGVITSVTGSNDTITVTTKNIDFTDSEATKAATDTTLSTTTTYVVTKVEQAADGSLSVTKTGIKVGAASNAFTNFTGGGDNTGDSPVTSNTGNAQPDTSGDTITFAPGNKWIDIAVDSSDDKITIGHSVPWDTAYTSADVYSIKIDKAGHITEATAAATGTVGLNALSYSVSTTAVDDFTLFSGTWGTANTVAELTGDKTFVK